MPFDIQDFLPRVNPEVADSFFKRYGNGMEIDWQQDAGTVARYAVDALANNDWAAGALESCQLIAQGGGRDLLRTAGDLKASLAPGVEDLASNDETCAVWLATHDRDIFDQVVSAAHARKGLGSRSWDAFDIVGTEPVHALSQDRDRMQKFQNSVEHIFTRRFQGVPSLRRIWVDQFEYLLERQVSHSRRPLLQVNVYGETAPRTLEVAVGGQRKLVQFPGIYRAAIVFDHSRQSIEVVTRGGRPARDALVKAFHATLLPEGVQLDRLVRRPINFDLFKSRPPLSIQADDPISSWDVDEIRWLCSSSM